jgi:predicted CXXCH cytochrome family protein
VRTLTPVTLVWLLAFPGYAHAQHANIRPGGSLETGGGCSVCHTLHPDRKSTYALILDRDMSQGAAWLRHQATGVTAVSLSCLRCHTSASVRQQQPEFARQAALAPERTLLGFDLGDDHFLGTFDPLMGPHLRGARDPADPRASRGGATILGDTTIVIECTTCHDPHDRVSATPDAAKQRMVCGTCHDLGAYLTRHHSGRACSDCHAVHGSTQAALLVGRGPEETCGRCHGGLGVPPSEGRPGFRAAPSGPRLPLSGDHQLGADCVSCHAMHAR